jgi:glutathione-regulated potassium-efflux system ancillary protein KefG
MSAISTGARRETYGAEDGVKYSFLQLLAPFQQTVSLCRMQYLPPFVTHGTHLLQEDQIKKSGEHYARVIERLAEGTLAPEALLKGEYMNDIIP